MVRGSSPDVDPAWGFRPQGYLATAQRFERVRLGELRIVPHRGGRDLAVGEGCRGSIVEAADDHRRAHIYCMDADGVGQEPDIDLELTVLGHEGVERSLGIADEVNGELVFAGRYLPQHVAARFVSPGAAIQVAQGDGCATDGLGRLRIPHSADDGPLHRLHHEQGLYRTQKDRPHPASAALCTPYSTTAAS